MGRRVLLCGMGGEKGAYEKAPPGSMVLLGGAVCVVSVSLCRLGATRKMGGWTLSVEIRQGPDHVAQGVILRELVGQVEHMLSPRAVGDGATS